MTRSPAPPLVVTLGDPAGIGPEVALRALEGRRDCLLVGDAALIAAAAERLAVAPPLRVHSPPEVACPPALLFSGAPHADCGRAAAAAVREGARLVAQGEGSALVTAPLNKEALGLAGEPFPGHTELLAHHFGGCRVRMLLQGPSLRVVLVTIHEALRKVPELIDEAGIVETCALAAGFLAAHGVAAPRLAVCALNPHGGDNGRFGDEDQRVVAPAIAAARAQGLDVHGPFAADTLFPQAARPDSPYAAVIAMYHDQGLIPVKLASFGTATNVTLGLPIVRTSPDHGTAFDIAGQGLADPSSMEAALRVAAELAAR
ncbi:MAG: 4-hydroxythreonine-4-phosphate dehydrogenase PdxA [Planctomycetes bacterium]|nr:4-hydroxythreonine-4-phosphate dehydrogenase PdxA [Planctomycetota bacterium]